MLKYISLMRQIIFWHKLFYITETIFEGYLLLFRTDISRQLDWWRYTFLCRHVIKLLSNWLLDMTGTSFNLINFLKFSKLFYISSLVQFSCCRETRWRWKWRFSIVKLKLNIWNSTYLLKYSSVEHSVSLFIQKFLMYLLLISL